MWWFIGGALLVVFLLFMYALGSAAKRGDMAAKRITVPVPQTEHDPLVLFEHFKSQALNASYTMQDALWLANRATFHVQERNMSHDDAFAFSIQEMNSIAPLGFKPGEEGELEDVRRDQRPEPEEFDPGDAPGVRAEVYSMPEGAGVPDQGAVAVLPPRTEEEWLEGGPFRH